MPLSLTLSNPVSFEPVSKVTHVFFDNKNQQIFSVRSGGVTGIMSRGFDDAHHSTFCLDSDQGAIITIKLSPDQKVLAIQRDKRSVQFIEVERNGPNGVLNEQTSFIQACKGKNAVLLGFTWMSNTDIVYFCDNGIEIYSIQRDKRLAKSVRTHFQQTLWHVFCPNSEYLVISPAQVTSTLHVFSVRNGYVYKLSKVEYDEECIREKDVSISVLYGKSYLTVVEHFEDKEEIKIHLYLMQKDSTNMAKSFILTLLVKGNVAINAIDDLLVVHHQASALSYLFDIEVPGDFDGNVTHLNPLCTAKVINDDLAATQNSYSINWIAFQPNVVIDAKLGYLWRLRLDLDVDTLLEDIVDRSKLITFLQQREGGKMVLLDTFLKICMNPRMKLVIVNPIFDLLVQQYKNHLDNEIQKQMGTPTSGFPSPVAAFKGSTGPTFKPVSKVMVDQADLFTHIFSVMDKTMEDNNENLFFLLSSYYLSLSNHGLRGNSYIDELLINWFIKNKKWYQIQQFIQYRVITDSKAIACILLSLEKVYEPANQLALDMLYRLGNAQDEIVEILLAKKDVISAIEFARKESLDHIPPKKYMQAALDSGDKMLYHNVFSYFQENKKLGSGYEEYKKHFDQLWEKKDNVD